MRTIELVNQELEKALNSSDKKTAKKLRIELMFLKQSNVVKCASTPNKKMEDTLDNSAAFAFYNS